MVKLFTGQNYNTDMKKIKLYIFWLKKKIGINTVDFEKGCGYYLPPRLMKGNFATLEANNGKVLRYEIVDIEYFRDPWDMIKYCKFSLVGIKGNKAIKDCSFKEFLKIYNP